MWWCICQLVLTNRTRKSVLANRTRKSVLTNRTRKSVLTNPSVITCPARPNYAGDTV